MYGVYVCADSIFGQGGNQAGKQSAASASKGRISGTPGANSGERELKVFIVIFFLAIFLFKVARFHRGCRY